MDEQSILYTYLPDISLIDYPGEKAAVFFTTGCNFRCGFCYNTSLLVRKTNLISLQELSTLLHNFKKNWATGVVITGGEPLINPDFPIMQTIETIKKEKLKIKLDTNGSFPKKLERLLPYLSYVAVDIKTSPHNYKKISGVPFCDNIKATVELLKTHKVKYEFRTTIIEGIHKQSDMVEIGELLKDTKLYILQAYLPEDSVKDPELKKLPRTSKSFLDKMADVVIPYVEKVEIRGAINDKVSLW